MSIFKKTVAVSLFFLLLLGGLFYFRYRVYYSHGNYSGKKMFEIKKGEGNREIASQLEEKGLIADEIYFYYYIYLHKLTSRIFPGEYQLSGSMSIGEIVNVITNPEEKFIKITFPEGFTVQQMTERLNASELPGDEFLKLANNPEKFKKRYGYLGGAEIKTLEGYLFPDTYFFKKDVSAEDIIGRMLNTFDSKLNEPIRKGISDKNKTIGNIVIMASIVEKEVQTFEDMKIVAGIFWNRIKIGQRLQSDAPLSYILNDKEDSHNAKDLNFDSPYNTYRYAGFPPTPISNPGLNAINAAIYPVATDYNYFLTATADGVKKVFYSKTYAEHLMNKRKLGL
jgi:UPF0755 protein